jgi:hypothetical protein
MLELNFDWTWIKGTEIRLFTEPVFDIHYFMIYDKKGNMVRGWTIERKNQ